MSKAPRWDKVIGLQDTSKSQVLALEPKVKTGKCQVKSKVLKFEKMTEKNEKILEHMEKLSNFNVVQRDCFFHSFCDHLLPFWDALVCNVRRLKRRSPVFSPKIWISSPKQVISTLLIYLIYTNLNFYPFLHLPLKVTLRQEDTVTHSFVVCSLTGFDHCSWWNSMLVEDEVLMLVDSGKKGKLLICGTFFN